MKRFALVVLSLVMISFVFTTKGYGHDSQRNLETINVHLPLVIKNFEANADGPFEGVPHPENTTFLDETEGDDRYCRNYTSTATPYSIVSNYATLLAGAPYLWDVGEVFKTGYEHDDTANFSATKDSREMAVMANGTGGFNSAMSVCILK